MISYETFSLANGLEVIVHSDHTNPNVCLNLLYKVGSRNESPDKTGFAHLFEHLMFGGSKHIPNFDVPLQKVGGENNAFTNTDITNYYTIVPSTNMETAFWLESDRMLSLSFDPKVLEVQQKVVIEEFKQRYLNQPYGDVWLKLRPVAYQVHPYQWPTIGKEIGHIEHATMEDVKDFFGTFYSPSNAILSIVGDITPKTARELTNKWFGKIPGRQPLNSSLPSEPKQTSPRELRVSGKVPHNAIYKVFHMPGRNDDRYTATDLLADLLGRGESSHLFQGLVKENELFSSISSYVMGTADPGLLVVQGNLSEGVPAEEANKQLDDAIQELTSLTNLTESLDRAKMLAESSHVFGEVELLNRAMNLAYAAFLEDTERVNTELDRIRNVVEQDIVHMADQVLDPNNCTTLIYEKE